jgi:hypothetical protein
MKRWELLLVALGPEIYGYSWAAVLGAWWLSLEEND